MTLQDDDPILVEQMLLWLYNQQYPPTTVERAEESLVNDAKIYSLADKYNLGLLKEVAKSCSHSMLDKHWNTDRFSEAATLIWQTTPASDSGLRQLVVASLWAHKEILLARDDVKLLINELDGFSKDLMLALTEDPSVADPTDMAYSNRRYCKSCDEIITAVRSGGSRTCPNAAYGKKSHVLIF